MPQHSSASTSLSRLHFPAKIYLMLENESPDIIRWEGNGTRFRIVDSTRYQQEIIPKYFRHNQYSSVQRQMNLYGFKCNFRGNDKGSFSHPEFFKGNWEAVKKLRRCLSHSQCLLKTVKLPGSESVKQNLDDDEYEEDEGAAPLQLLGLSEEDSRAERSGTVSPEVSSPPQKPFSSPPNILLTQRGSDMEIAIHSTGSSPPNSLRIELAFKLPSELTIVDIDGVSFHLAPMAVKPVVQEPVPALPVAVPYQRPIKTHIQEIPPFKGLRPVNFAPAKADNLMPLTIPPVLPAVGGSHFQHYDELANDMWCDLGSLLYYNGNLDDPASF